MRQCHSASASRQRRRCASPCAGRELDAGQAQAEVGAGALGGQRPGGQPRQARLGRPARRRPSSRATARWRADALVSRLTSSARSRAPAPPSSTPPASAGRRGGRCARRRSRRPRCAARGVGPPATGRAAGRRRRVALGLRDRPAAAPPAATPSRRGTGRAESASRRSASARSCRPRCARHEADVRASPGRRRARRSRPASRRGASSRRRPMP